MRDLALLLLPEENNKKYQDEDGIILFVREVLGVVLAPYQEDILRMLVRDKRVAVRAPHAAGKTALSAFFVLWAVTVFAGSVKVVTTASAWRQVEYYTWPEIRLWAGRADWHKTGTVMRRGKELLELKIKLPGGKQAFAVASDNPALIEGAHADTIVYVFDEAKSIPDGIWDAAEGAFSAAGGDTDKRAFALAISTPGLTSGRFYDIHIHKPGYEDWATRHITLEECLRAGRISQEWVDARKRQWGEKSSIYQNRVEGKFSASGEGVVVPLEWIELAHARWYANGGVDLDNGRVSYGVDPAYLGEDKTAICRLSGRVVEWIVAYAKQEIMQTAGRVVTLVEKNKDVPIAVDTIGVGAGVYSRLAEQEYAVRSVNVSRKAPKWRDVTGKLEFVNLRCALWWMIRDALDPDGDDPLALPDIPELTGDLTAPTWGYRSDGKIVVESKKETRARIGRSPDFADALALALYAGRAARPLIMI